MVVLWRFEETKWWFNWGKWSYLVIWATQITIFKLDVNMNGGFKQPFSEREDNGTYSELRWDGYWDVKWTGTAAEAADFGWYQSTSLGISTSKNRARNICNHLSDGNLGVIDFYWIKIKKHSDWSKKNDVIWPTQIGLKKSVLCVVVHAG